VADYLGLGGRTEEQKVQKLLAAIAELQRQLDVPATIREAGVPEEAFMAKVDELAELAFDDQCTGANPRYPLIADLRNLYLQAYYGADGAAGREAGQDDAAASMN